MNDEEIYDLLIKKLTENIPIMRNYEVKKKSKEVDKKAYNSCYKVELISASFGRCFLMSLIKHCNHMSVFMCVCKPNTNKYSDYLFVDTYLRHLKIDDVNKIMVLSNNPNETLDIKLQDFFSRFLTVVDELFFEILEGKEWIEIPFDWEPYK